MAEIIDNAIDRDGNVIRIGDHVSTDFHPSCVDRVFVVFEINRHDNCESGFMILAHLKDSREREIRGVNGQGLDTNWFKVVKCPEISKKI